MVVYEDDCLRSLPTPFNWHGELPAGLCKLRLGREFNFPLEPGVLPHGLEQLQLGDSFQQPLLAGVLPPGLTWLDLGRLHQQPLELLGVLPSSLADVPRPAP